MDDTCLDGIVSFSIVDIRKKIENELKRNRAAFHGGVKVDLSGPFWNLARLSFIILLASFIWRRIICSGILLYNG